LLGCFSSVNGATGQKPGEPGTLVVPNSPTGWYAPAEFGNAVQVASTLGQPLAVIYQETNSTCPKHNSQREAWMRTPELAGFVRAIVESDDPNQAELVQKFRQDAGARAGKFIPMLFLGTSSGTLLGVVPYKAPPLQLQATIGEALKSFGPVLPPKTACELWKKLKLGRSLWKKGKTDAAMTCYQAIKHEERKNPKLPIFDELRNDEAQINQKGAEELVAVKTLLEQGGDTGEARTALATIRRRYVKFEPAEEAKALQLTLGAIGRTRSDPAPAPGKPAARTWSDVSGTHQIEAELVAVKDGKVRLKKAAGDCVNVPLDRLAHDDRKYVERWLAQHHDAPGKSDRDEASQ
jgi:hypothetical protein